MEIDDLNKEKQTNHWLEWLACGERMVDRALRELGRLGVDEMLIYPDEPVTNEGWPGADITPDTRGGDI